MFTFGGFSSTFALSFNFCGIGARDKWYKYFFVIIYFTFIVNFRMLGMKQFDQEGFLKQWNITLLLYQAMLDLARLQLSVFVTVLLHCKLWAKQLMPLQIVVWPWPLMQITLRFASKICTCCCTLVARQFTWLDDLLLFLLSCLCLILVECTLL